MRAIDGLERIRARLETLPARPATLDTVDELIEKFRRTPGGGNAEARSLGQLLQMLMRTPAANNSTVIYDDLTRLEMELTQASERIRAEREAADSRPAPRPAKYYKDLKKKEQEEKARGER